MITTARTFTKGEIIYHSGDTEKKLYVIHTGRVKITKMSESGKEQIIRIVGPGDFLGELSLFVQAPLNNSAEALETTRVCVIDGTKLKEMITRNPGIAAKILQELSRRLLKAENLIESLGLQDVEQRVASMLLDMSEGKAELQLQISKKDLAAHIGISQETLSRKLSQLEEQGLIEQTGQRKIRILDRDSLKAMSKDEL
ncbi:MAG TPA: Crp/Fnr family transcriptional regulator [Negativicutes bacterium]|nr:Crp/Fnr family transcriptional regulator [Negativicutes bacterium]